MVKPQPSGSRMEPAVKVVLIQRSCVYSTDDSMIRKAKHQIETLDRTSANVGPHSIEPITYRPEAGSIPRSRLLLQIRPI